MSILEYNGGDMVAMVGESCVAIASDTRLGNQGQTIACDYEKIFRVSEKILVGLPGLATDTQTFLQLLTFKLNMYRLEEEREMKPEVLSSLISSTQYERRFGPYFIEPIMAGLNSDGKPFITAMDVIGSPVVTEDFVVGGCSTENLYGLCETLFRPNMNESELFETISQVLLASVDRDALSGWGAVVHILGPKGMTTKKLKSRVD
mmetsp:Transcript_10887/g.16241  ORF Transcript_10887/g.16241 Transcript_10887/m.16241 type:complete len:205 (+) Transcript_10887:42-656(+)|eukprot:CAMPEP_0171479452 /NCGR_PEP_ID=MMETSP0946-20130122/5436_1 /TAXON_ID=109269 /ORGANISM="Vaucheria litorea, Strain CCMP2940" /LENGTH=204 /DNA_ID=CAMNT_0012010391 /DNA_START=33 /DNA_END=647 /DNA_ORIENTATION=-